MNRYSTSVIVVMGVLLTGCSDIDHGKITELKCYMASNVSTAMMKLIMKNKGKSMTELTQKLILEDPKMKPFIFNPNIDFWEETFHRNNKKYLNYIRVYCKTNLFAKKYQIRYLGVTFGGKTRLFKNKPDFDRGYSLKHIDLEKGKLDD